MKAVTPTVTWPNHTTLVTGVMPARHGVVGNNYFDRAGKRPIALIADPIFDKDQIVKTPTIYDLAKERGLRTAAIRWPASRNARTLDWTIPDVRTAGDIMQSTTPELKEACQSAGIDLEAATIPDGPIDEKFANRDSLWTNIFLDVLRKHRPNLALLHIAEVDHIEHLDGPRSRGAYAAIKNADEQVRLVWEELEADFPGTATLFVVSDHGFSAIKRNILPNVVLANAGLATVADGVWSGGPTAAVCQAGAVFVYVLDDARRDELIPEVRRAFTGLEGVAKIISGDEFKAYGVADPQDDPHAPDLIVFAQMGYAFGDTAAGQLPFADKPERLGTHGHDPNLPDLQATFVAVGVGIQPGVKLDLINNTCVAPTIARLLDLEIPNPDGHVLTDILAH